MAGDRPAEPEPHRPSNYDGPNPLTMAFGQPCCMRSLADERPHSHA
ncbi:predicted protein [Plenodomus lingam JN3]|uniref:Predicted protein n=1 Tax=Leptosphaeria maculans (strain JN3 / isolate v23.1.3 / race Av1-4-5-6-7-8) TaxID=985895 RepID=E4ZME3_LEPMJ|nr:predicted protein [Plenodomus lingam JN3]CBX92492.1 predicted protein [Plenodomus lingam JN3]